MARRTGVSHGTLCNLFGSREALTDEVVTDLAADRLDKVAQRPRDQRRGHRPLPGRRTPDGRLRALPRRRRARHRASPARRCPAPGLHRRGPAVHLRHQRPAGPGRQGHRPPMPGAAVSPSCSTACGPRPPTRSRPPR
ncbi:hypothetical protein ACQ4WX_47410 [Streptomyces lasalocidi]